jgi:hypothetical protein
MGEIDAVLDWAQRPSGQLTPVSPFSSIKSSPCAMPINQTDDDLSRLERDIRQLKIEYEQYFGGGRKRAPADIEWRIDQTIKRYGDRSAEMNFAQRFRYGNLAQTYVKYRDIFRKRMQRREEGREERHFGAAARAIEAERARQAKSPAAQVAVICSDGSTESGDVDQLYRAFCEALQSSGQATDKLSRAKFEKFLAEKSEQIRKRGQQVEFVVSVEGGKARLKARVKS